jgi:hypothetical protein
MLAKMLRGRMMSGAVIAAGMLLGMTAPAFADHNHDGGSKTTIVFFPGVLLTTSTVGMVVASSPMITTSSTTSSTSDAISSCGDGPALAMYIEQNSDAMEQDIAMGGGQTVADLAAMIQLPEDQHATLGKALRHNKRGFTEVLRAQGLSSQERARAFAAQLKLALDEA